MEALQPKEGDALKRIRFALNIITPDNFEILKGEIHELAKQSLENCIAVANQIASNAWDQKPYARTYARLCRFLGDKDTLRFNQEKNEPKTTENDLIRHVLGLVESVMEFDGKLILTAEKTLSSYPANYEKNSQNLKSRRRRLFGNVMFIGELFLEQVIRVQVARRLTAFALRKFLHGFKEYKKDTQKDPEQLYEDPLGYLLLFYDNYGEKLDEREHKKPEAKVSKPNDAVELFEKDLKAVNADAQSDVESNFDEVSLHDFFQILEIFSKERVLSQRLDFFVLNLKERREKGWIDHPGKEEGPKTMKEIHEDFQKELEARDKMRELYFAMKESFGQTQAVESGQAQIKED